MLYDLVVKGVPIITDVKFDENSHLIVSYSHFSTSITLIFSNILQENAIIISHFDGDNNSSSTSFINDHSK